MLCVTNYNNKFLKGIACVHYLHLLCYKDCRDERLLGKVVPAIMVIDALHLSTQFLIIAKLIPLVICMLVRPCLDENIPNYELSPLCKLSRVLEPKKRFKK